MSLFFVSFMSMTSLTYLVILCYLLRVKREGALKVWKLCTLGMTWQLELHDNSTENGLARLLYWRPSISVSLSLSFWAFSRFSWSRFF